MAESEGSSGDFGWGAAGVVLGLLCFLAGLVALLPLPPWANVAAALWLLLCGTALLGLLDAASRRHIARQLTDARFTQAYRFTASRQLNLLWRRVCDPVEADAGLATTVRAALTWRLYDAALLIAVAYPILLLVGWWILGFDGRLGSATVLPAAPLWPDRAVTLGGIVLILGSLPVSRRAAAAAAAAAAVAFAGAVAGAVAGAAVGAVAGAAVGAVAVAALSSVALAVAVAVAVAGAGAVAGAVVGATAVAAAVAGKGAVAAARAAVAALAVAVPVAVLDYRGRHRTARVLVTLLLPVLWIAGALLVPWASVPDDQRVVFLFLGVLPLVNALFDVLSYAVTLTLMRRGLRARQPLLYGLADLAVAGILFLALGATLTLVIAGLNRLAGPPILDLGSLFAGLHTAPHDYWWLYAMIFSTLIPTLLHAGLSLLGAQALVPLRLRAPAARLVTGATGAAWKAAAAPLALGTVWFLPFAAGAAALWGLWRVSRDALAALGGVYLDVLTALAGQAGAL